MFAEEKKDYKVFKMKKVNVYDGRGKVYTVVENNSNLGNERGLTMLRDGSYVLIHDGYAEIITKFEALDEVLMRNVDLLTQKKFEELKKLYESRMEVTDYDALMSDAWCKGVFEYMVRYFNVSDKGRIWRFICDNDLYNPLVWLRYKIYDVFDKSVPLKIDMVRDDQDNIKSIIVIIDTFLSSRLAQEKVNEIRSWFDEEFECVSNLIGLSISTEVD